MTARRVLFCTYKILVVVYTAQAAYILYDEKCREHGCIHFAYGEFWEVPGAWLHTFYMMKSASSLYKMTVRGSCTKIVWRFSSISYCCFGVKYSSTVLYYCTIPRIVEYSRWNPHFSNKIVTLHVARFYYACMSITIGCILNPQTRAFHLSKKLW